MHMIKCIVTILDKANSIAKAYLASSKIQMIISLCQSNTQLRELIV